jgi:hypothetical protein
MQALGGANTSGSHPQGLLPGQRQRSPRGYKPSWLGDDSGGLHSIKLKKYVVSLVVENIHYLHCSFTRDVL